MNRISTIFGSVTLGLAALVIVNLIFFGFVVGLDIAFGEAPEFTVPLLVPILICLGLLLTVLIRRRRSLSGVGSDSEQPSGEHRTVQIHNVRPRSSRLRSALVIRRHSKSQYQRRESGVYETSI